MNFDNIIQFIEKNPIMVVNILLMIISVLLFLLFSPNVCRFIHKKHLTWK